MSKISWTEKTWNPIVGCSIVSPGCTNCYAMGLANRLLDKPGSHYEGTTKKVNGNAVWTGKIALAPEDKLMEPYKRKKPTTYFVNSMGDLFHEDAPDDWIDKILAIMALCPQHTFQVLTKRAERMREYFKCDYRFAMIEGGAQAIHEKETDEDPSLWLAVHDLPNVWLGVSAENQEQANTRIPFLLDTPATIRFVSLEPQLEEINLNHLHQGYCNMPSYPEESYIDALAGMKIDGWQFETPKIEWVIQGCESGHGRRPFNIKWAISMRDQCAGTNTAYFLKQIPNQAGKVITDPIFYEVRHAAYPKKDQNNG